jgi:hypothetical protein
MEEFQVSYVIFRQGVLEIKNQVGLPENINATIITRRFDDRSYCLRLIPDTKADMNEEGFIC